jgi:hypothetical protein
MPEEVACESVVIACDSAPLFLPFTAASQKCVKAAEKERRNSTISENRLFFLCVLSKKKGGVATDDFGFALTSLIPNKQILHNIP